MFSSYIYSVLNWVKTAFPSTQHLQEPVLGANVSHCKLLEAGVNKQRYSHFAAFHVDDVEDPADDLLLHFLQLRQKSWLVLEKLLRLLVKVFLFEFFTCFKDESVFWNFQLSSQIKDNALKQVKGVLVEVLHHN